MSAGQSRVGALPNLIVIGAQKCGTSALHYYLGLHPEVQMSSPKELCFFIAPEDFDPDPFVSDPRERALIAIDWNWPRGIDWYAGHFSPEATVRGESSPQYTGPWHRGVAARMAEAIPGARLIFLARDPVERIVSSYAHVRADGREWRSFEEAVGRPGSPYLERTRYASVLRPFLDAYPRSRVLLLRHEDLLHARRETMRRVFRFAGVDELFWSPKMERRRQPSDRKGRRFSLATRLAGSRLAAPLYRLPQEAKWALERVAYARTPTERPAVDDRLRAWLLEELEPEIRGLEELTGWDLAGWRARSPAPSRL
jgi:hypothetical protein